jgi:hypothetical protein
MYVSKFVCVILMMVDTLRLIINQLPESVVEMIIRFIKFSILMPINGSELRRIEKQVNKCIDDVLKNSLTVTIPEGWGQVNPDGTQEGGTQQGGTQEGETQEGGASEGVITEEGIPKKMELSCE